jgi:hypothetical protein
LIFFFFLAYWALKILEIVIVPNLHGKESLYALQAKVMDATLRQHSTGLAHLAQAYHALGNSLPRCHHGFFILEVRKDRWGR